MKDSITPSETTASDQTQDQKEFQIVATSAVAAFKERLRKRLNERYFFEMDAPLLMAPSQFGKLLKLIDETP